MEPQYEEFTLSIPFTYYPDAKPHKQFEALVSYEHNGDKVKPDSIQFTVSPFMGMYLQNMTGLMGEVIAAVENNLQSVMESKKEEKVEFDEQYEIERQLKGWPQAFKND